MEVKIQIPNNCELIKDGDTYIVKEKEQTPPRSWKEFCERYPIKKGEAFIDTCGNIESRSTECERHICASQNWCVSKEEAEAFLALMQLRQLRKAWVGDWNPGIKKEYGIIYYSNLIRCFNADFGIFNTPGLLTFPTKEMAKEFLECFKDLCETAKILL